MLRLASCQERRNSLSHCDLRRTHLPATDYPTPRSAPTDSKELSHRFFSKSVIERDLAEASLYLIVIISASYMHTRRSGMEVKHNPRELADFPRRRRAGSPEPVAPIYNPCMDSLVIA